MRCVSIRWPRSSAHYFVVEPFCTWPWPNPSGSAQQLMEMEKALTKQAKLQKMHSTIGCSQTLLNSLFHLQQARPRPPRLRPRRRNSHSGTQRSKPHSPLQATLPKHCAHYRNRLFGWLLKWSNNCTAHKHQKVQILARATKVQHQSPSS